MHAFVLMMVSMDGLPNQNSLPMCKYHKGPALTLILSSVFIYLSSFVLQKWSHPKKQHYSLLQKNSAHFMPR